MWVVHSNLTGAWGTRHRIATTRVTHEELDFVLAALKEMSIGGDKFRVLYADLTIRDADQAPQVKGAKKIEKASQTSKPAAK